MDQEATILTISRPPSHPAGLPRHDELFRPSAVRCQDVHYGLADDLVTMVFLASELLALWQYCTVVAWAALAHV
jgi:hypothetical protein